MKKYKIRLMGGKDFTQTKDENEEFIQGTYKKAKIRTLNNGTKELYSYETKVAIITKGGNFIRLWEGCSQTTMKHINEFRVMNGMKNINSKEWKELPISKNHNEKLRLKLYGNDKKKDEIFELEQIEHALNRFEKRAKEFLWRNEYFYIRDLFNNNKSVSTKYTLNGITLEIVRC